MIYFIVINILLLVVLISILVNILIRSYLCSRLCGEIYSGLGIALIASSLVAYNFSNELTLFIISLIGGLISLIIGVLMIFFSESILINQSS